MTFERAHIKENLFSSLSGRSWPFKAPYAVDMPLVIAVHGGTYSSAYFDVPGYSLFEKTQALNIPLIAVDRPGYGHSSALEVSSATIEGQARFLMGALGDAWEKYGQGTSGIVLLGHSIGAAVAVTIAAENKDLPLLGVALSGVGLRTPAHYRDAWDSLPDTYMVDMPNPIKDEVMFGPPGSYADAMPQASYEAYTSAPKAELVDIVGGWSDRVEGLLGKITVPVHYRQAEIDKLWIVSQEEVDGFAKALKNSVHVDAAMVKNSGHCMDYHRISSALQVQQLGFALQCAQEAYWRK